MHENGAQTHDDPIIDTQIGRSLSAAVQNQKLVSDRYRFRNDRPIAAKRQASDQGNEHVDEKNEDIAHMPNATRASESALIQSDFPIRHTDSSRR